MRAVKNRKIRKEIDQAVVAGVNDKSSAQGGAKETAQRTAWQREKHNWDCSQIAKKEEEEEEAEGQMEVQCEEDVKLEENLERRMEGSSLQPEVMQKVLGLVCMTACLKAKTVKCRYTRKEESEWMFY